MACRVILRLRNNLVVNGSVLAEQGEHIVGYPSPEYAAGGAATWVVPMGMSLVLVDKGLCTVDMVARVDEKLVPDLSGTPLIPETSLLQYFSLTR